MEDDVSLICKFTHFNYLYLNTFFLFLFKTWCYFRNNRLIYNLQTLLFTYLFNFQIERLLHETIRFVIIQNEITC